VIGHEGGAQKAGVKIATVKDVPKVLGIKGWGPRSIEKTVIPYRQKIYPKTAG
jgi:hypothetical protein